MKHYKDGDYLFDGFAHRSFDSSIDGWRNELPDVRKYPSVSMANDIIEMFDELSAAKRRIWELEQQLKRYTGR